MKVLILAAGYAVRLKELTQDNPKPLLEVAGQRIIDRIIDKVAALKAAGHIYIITNGRFFEKFRGWLKGSSCRDRISIINDLTASNETRLGAIRDMEYAVRQKSIDDDLLVIAGDNLFDFDLAGFLAFAQSRPDGISVALYDIKDLNAAKRFGVVKVDGDSRITNFEEKPAVPKSTLISTGVYYFPKEKLSLIGEYLKVSDKIDAPGYYIGWLSETGRVYGYTFSEDWYDIGDIESYQRADRNYLKKGE